MRPEANPARAVPKHAIISTGASPSSKARKESLSRDPALTRPNQSLFTNSTPRIPLRNMLPSRPVQNACRPAGPSPSMLPPRQVQTLPERRPLIPALTRVFHLRHVFRKVNLATNLERQTFSQNEARLSQPRDPSRNMLLSRLVQTFPFPESRRTPRPQDLIWCRNLADSATTSPNMLLSRSVRTLARKEAVDPDIDERYSSMAQFTKSNPAAPPNTCCISPSVQTLAQKEALNQLRRDYPIAFFLPSYPRNPQNMLSRPVRTLPRKEAVDPRIDKA